MNRRKHFLQAITAVQEPDIATCAMIIAGEFQPGLDIQGELGAIDQLVTEAKSFPVVDAHSLVEFLAVKKSFTGNVENYYSLSNSLLNQVLSSKRGIPITLALVYLSVVQKLKPDTPSLETEHLNAWGINFPGHFLVAVSDDKGEHLVDPFKGCLVTREECYYIIANLYGRHHEPDDHYFERANSRLLLRRILENLKAINLQKGFATHAMVCLDYQLMLYPDAVDLLQQQDDLLSFLRDKGQSGESRLQ
jgi:regulator of sirC expression with transglutaminase-like and TPR domain